MKIIGKFCPNLKTILDIFGENSNQKRKYLKAKIYSKFDFVSMYTFLGQLANNEKMGNFVQIWKLFLTFLGNIALQKQNVWKPKSNFVSMYKFSGLLVNNEKNWKFCKIRKIFLTFLGKIALQKKMCQTQHLFQIWICIPVQIFMAMGKFDKIIIFLGHFWGKWQWNKKMCQSQ